MTPLKEGIKEWGGIMCGKGRHARGFHDDNFIEIARLELCKAQAS